MRLNNSIHRRTLLAVAIAGSLAATGATADTIGFDNFTTDSSTALVAGYGKLNWNNFYVLNTDPYQNSGYVNGTVSPRETLNNSARPERGGG